LDLLGALATHPRLDNLTVCDATVEAKASFDAHAGNVRNHDLVLRATDLSEFVTVEFERRAREKAMDLSLDRSAMCRGPDGPGRVCTRSRNGSFSPLRK